MLPGDIDLTESLDFRKVRKREIPQIPEEWNGGKIKNKLNTYLSDNANITLSNSSISFNVTNTYLHTEMDTVYNISDSNWVETMPDTLTTHDSITRLSVSYTSNTSSITNTNTYYFSSDDDYLTFNNCGIKFIQAKEEYDVFGNKKRDYREYIPNIPWKTSIYKPHIKPIAWDDGYRRYWVEDNTEPNIPWRNYRLKPKYDLDRYDRAKNLITWLSDKSRSFIQKYLDKDDDKVLSYLTNMSWIRIRDAVIDSI